MGSAHGVSGERESEGGGESQSESKNRGEKSGGNIEANSVGAGLF